MADGIEGPGNLVHLLEDCVRQGTFPGVLKFYFDICLNVDPVMSLTSTSLSTAARPA